MFMVKILCVFLAFAAVESSRWGDLLTSISQQWSSQHNQDGTHCDHEDRKDHAINLLNEWVKHHHYDAVQKLYHDIYHKDLPGRRKRQFHYQYKDDFDEAFNHHNTVPDYMHVESYIATMMNQGCRNEIMKWIENLAHTHQAHTEKPTTQAATTKGHVNAHAQTTHPTKTTTRAPTTTQSPPATTVIDITKYACNPVTFVTALATSSQLLNDNAGLCTDGSKSQPEALVLESCKAPTTTDWRQGTKVVGNCKNIPDYSPIGTFIFGEYELNGLHMAGVLTECTATGFKMAIQLCGHPVDIIELKSGAANERENADNYYAITW